MHTKKAKSIVVIYWGDDWNKKIPIENEASRHAFEEWHKMGLKKNIKMFRASLKWYDPKKNVFRKAWAFRNGKWIKIKQAIKSDLVYDKVAGKYDAISFDKKI